MINVTTTKKNDEYIAIEIAGHAQSGPYGFDLVCAGVSAVTFGAVNALFEIGGFTPIVEQADKGGYLYVELPDDLTADQMMKSQIIFETMMISLQTIERQYRQFIQIN